MPQKLLMFEANYNTTQQTTMTQIALTTLEALIGLELMALATISKYKATIYKTWQPLAEKWKHFIMDDCTEHDKTFTLDLPCLPEKVQANFECNFDHESLPELVDNFGVDVTVTGYQVAQQLVILFHVFLDSILLPYCLDSLDRLIEIAHNTRYILIYHITNDDAFVYLDIGETA